MQILCSTLSISHFPFFHVFLRFEHRLQHTIRLKTFGKIHKVPKTQQAPSNRFHAFLSQPCDQRMTHDFFLFSLCQHRGFFFSAFYFGYLISRRFIAISKTQTKWILWAKKKLPWNAVPSGCRERVHEDNKVQNKAVSVDLRVKALAEAFLTTAPTEFLAIESLMETETDADAPSLRGYAIGIYLTTTATNKKWNQRAIK